MDHTALLTEVQNFVTAYFDTHHDARFSYHNGEHTREVVAAVTKIADHYQLEDDERFAVITAAWFHDIAHQSDDPAEHEEKGALIAIDFLKGLNVEESVTDKVRDCILATAMPQNPQTLLEEILCDADLFHLGTPDFREKSKELRKELQRIYHKDISKQEWRKKTAELMEQHRYHTDYCRLLLNEQKEKNLQWLRSKIKPDKKEKDIKMKNTKPDKVTLLPPAPGENKKDVKKRIKEKPTKGRETMFRVTGSNHQRLSDMADRKAHIMISVNSIVISLLLSLMLRRLDEHPRQTIPAIILLLVSLVTIIFSVLATRPNLPAGTFTQEDIDRKQVNLLFFGNFYKMSLDQYNHGMVAMLNDSDFLYGSLIRDLYTQGTVLGRKYKLLRISYSVFMYGLIVSVLAFIVSAIM